MVCQNICRKWSRENNKDRERKEDFFVLMDRWGILEMKFRRWLISNVDSIDTPFPFGFWRLLFVFVPGIHSCYHLSWDCRSSVSCHIYAKSFDNELLTRNLFSKSSSDFGSSIFAEAAIQIIIEIKVTTLMWLKQVLQQFQFQNSIHVGKSFTWPRIFNWSIFCTARISRQESTHHNTFHTFS